MESNISPPAIPPRSAPALPSTPPYYYSQAAATGTVAQSPYSVLPQQHFPFSSAYFPLSSAFGGMGNTQAVTGPLRSILLASQQLVQAFTGIAQVLDSAYVATFASFSATMTIVEQLRQLKHYLFARRKSPKFSPKPLALFLIGCALIPWLLNKLNAHLQVNSPTTSEEQQQPKKQFAVALYSFDGLQAGDLPVKRDEIVALLSTQDNGWSQCRTEDGRIGAVPTNHLKLIGK